MKKLAVLFGSRTVEHDVSIVTGLQLLENVDKTKYDAYPVYISRKGEWFVGDPLKDVSFYKNFSPEAKGITKVYLPPIPGYDGLYAKASGGLLKKTDAKVMHMDCAILAMHGMHGEDGTLQGLFEMADIPYSSAGVTGAAVGMDKIVMKAVFSSMGLPVLQSQYYYRKQFKEHPEQVMDGIEAAFSYPLIIKPANLGSSIGIGIAHDRRDLKNKLDVAAHYDRRILAEKCITDLTEINCACVGYGDDCMASLCEQPVKDEGREGPLSFDEKYLRGGKTAGSKTQGKGMASLSRIIPAPISEEMTEKIQTMTKDVFRMLECKGVVRIDYMIDNSDGNVYINEINTIPGSFAYYLFEPMGVTYMQLIDKLVEGAYAARKEKLDSEFAYNSDILSSVVLNGAKGSGTKR
ncbi:D-alanine--D-alanine ligase [Christensenellaceae bacterium OttesenSCG-928-M15]|nr:D-alanine--D-alanine ligase [Christensenellaceae bacterium OttesenSCG-928-M15]